MKNQNTIHLRCDVAITRAEVEERLNTLTDVEWRYVKYWTQDTGNWLDAEDFKVIVMQGVKTAVMEAKNRYRKSLSKKAKS
jgi:hypothetical protein